MAHKNEALLIIDYTNDFVAKNGVLTAGLPAQALAPKIIQLADRFVDHGSWIILPTDVHTPHDTFHPESNILPPHNVRNTWDRRFFGDLQPWFEQHQNDERVYMFDKTRYISFTGTDLDLRLRELKLRR